MESVRHFSSQAPQAEIAGLHPCQQCPLARSEKLAEIIRKDGLKVRVGAKQISLSIFGTEDKWRTVCRMFEAGRLPAFKVSGQLLARPAELRAFMEAQERWNSRNAPWAAGSVADQQE